MLIEYYFKIKYIKGKDNTGVDILSQMLGLQDDKDITRAILKLN